MFSAHGRKPTNLDEANEREKDIRYSSRTMLTTDTLREKHCVRHAINELHKLLPPGLANTEQAKRLYEHGCVTVMDIVQLIYRPIEPQAALQRLRVQPLDYGISMATGVLRCTRDLAGLSLARGNADRGRRASLRHSQGQSQRRLLDGVLRCGGKIIVVASPAGRIQSKSASAGRATPSSRARSGFERARTRIPSRTPSSKRARSFAARF